MKILQLHALMSDMTSSKVVVLSVLVMKLFIMLAMHSADISINLQAFDILRLTLKWKLIYTVKESVIKMWK